MKLAINADGLVPVARARLLVHARCHPTSPVNVGLGEALGCVTSAEVRSSSRIPMFDNSAMDGYAVRSADCADPPSRLRVIDRVMAGRAPGRPVRPGQAIRIMTGAPLPEGADAICALEHTTGEAGSVVVKVPVTPGQHIRRVGEDVESGDLVVAAGTVLTGLHLGLLASVGCPSVEVHRRPRVAVLSTGDELATPGTSPGPGEIFDSNRVMLLGHVAAAGCDALDVGRVADDPVRAAASITSAATWCDAVITTGGVSVGDRDIIRTVLEDTLTADGSCMQLALKPARPFGFAILRASGVPLFGLPGNPAAAAISFELMVRPALWKMSGRRQLDRPCIEAISNESLVRHRDGRLHVVPAIGAIGPDGWLHVRSAGQQGAHRMSPLAMANSLALLPDGPGVSAGGHIAVMPLVDNLIPHRCDVSETLGATVGPDSAWTDPR